MKYNTRQIDYTGCHPVIAEHLKRGEAVECFVNDIPARGHMRYWVLAYWIGEKYPYRTRGEAFRYAEPIPSKVRRIMPPERAIPVLIADGWRFNQFGQMENGVRPFLVTGAYQMMGCTLEEAEKYEMYWPPCIIEEMEDDE